MNTYPLLQSQLGIFLQCIQNPQSTQYNLPNAGFMTPAVDIERLIDAWQRLIDARPEFRTRFIIDDNGEPRQWSDTEMQIPIVRRKMSEAEMQTYIHDGLVRPFDLLSGEPLFRIEFIETEKGWWQVTDGHHVVFDGMSFTPVIMQIDINKAYMGEELTPHPYGMYQAAEDEVATFGTEVYEKAKAYYAEKFAGLDFATLSRSESGSMGKMARRSTFINRQLCDDWCKEHGVPINLLFQAAFSHILSVLLRQEKVAYFTVNHGRMDKRLRECIGMFVKSVPILANCTTDTTVTEFIKSFRTELMSTIRYGVYPFNHFCRDLKMTSGVSFNFQALADMEEAMILGDERIYGVQPVRDMIDDDMTVFIFFNGENYEMRVESSSAMNDEATLQMMADAMLATMNNMMAAPDGKLKDIAIVSPDEEQQLLALSKGETLDYDTTETWISLFRRQVENRPDAVAVADAKGTYTYKALDEASDAVALYLIEKGLKADDFVAIRMDRSREFMAAALGCHKASVGYVPIDLDYPAERVDYMLQDSGAKLTIDEQTVSEALAGSYSGTLRPATPENLAYMIYTSGSTGQPKGVMIQHKALLNFVHFIRKEWRLTEQSRIACHSNFAFDAAVEDLYPVLTTGGTLYIVPEEARLDISLLRQYLKDNAITGGCYTTQLGQLLGSDAPLDVDYICLGGEKMTAVPQTTGRVLNTYGPTEFTVDSTFFEVAPDKSYDNIPIGRPLYNLYALVLDGNGHLVPEGAVGELCMAGPQMAKGYWNRPDLTAEKFCDVTIGGRTMKVYHTGDLVRYNDSGNLEFLGRIDFQVKLRGFRIELGEIESRANQFDGIQQVAAEVKNGQTLCLYYTASTDIDKEALKAFLAETLADYMVPSALMQLDEMPLTPNGKVNRKALPEPELEAGEIVMPATELEQQLFDIVATLLQTDKFGVTTNLVAMGLSSLAAMRLGAAIQKQLGLQVKMAAIMKSPTIRDIVALLDDDQAAGKGLTLHAYERRDSYPLSENQRGVYVDWEMNRDTTQYNIPFVYRFQQIDTERFMAALKATVEAHSYLKTRLVMADGDVMQQRHDDEETVITLQKLDEEPATDFFQQLVKPFNLFTDRLYRIVVYQAPKAVYLFMDIHHMVFDGLSTNVFLHDALNAYNGQQPEAEQLTAYDFALYEQELMQSTEFEKAEQRFDTLVADANVLSYPASAQPDGKPSAYTTLPFSGTGIMDFCAANNITIGSYMQAAFAEVMSRLTREKDNLYLTITNGRSADAALQSCVGMFVKTLPVVRPATTEGTTTADFAKAMHEQLQQSYEQDFYPYTRLVERHKHHAEVMFVYQGGLSEGNQVDGIEEVPLELDTAKMPLDVSVYPDGDGYMLLIEYDGTIYNKVDVDRLARAFVNTAQNMTVCDRLADVALVSPEEEQQLLSLSKGETLDYDTTETWISLFRRQVESRPDAVAVADADGTYTYKALDEASDAVALYLIEKGLKADDFVAIRMDRSREFMAAALGCHKASVGYVPIDLDYPAERVDYMLQDSGAKLTIDEQTVSEALAGSYSGTLRPATPENLAYMIYTSGSTGQPKGVMIQHKALLNFVHFIRKEWRLTEQSRIACHSNFAFDAAVEDLYPVLTTGGTLYIVPEEARLDISLLRQYLKDNAITGGCYTTQLGQLLGSDAPLDVDYICLGGEKMTAVPQTTGRVLNTYGPTEFTVDSTFFEVAPDKSYDNIPIGRPLYNLYALVLDGNGHLVPEGAVGELCMAGPQMAKGYWNRPDLTAEKFCDVTIGGRTMKVYHTGDLVRYNDSGNLEFLGRIDFQVKLRGFRIELGEIESRANQFDGIQQVAAEVKNGQTLCLYYTASTDIDKEALKAFLAETLADYMVPSALMQLDEMPLTPNGKVNRKALPEPAITSSAEYVEPEGDVERKVADTMQQILRLSQPVGALDSFMELGGDSIKAIRLVSTLRQLDVNIAVADVMKLKTVRAIAAAHTETSISISQEPWSGEVGDTPIVNYFKDLSLPKPAHYLQSMMLHCSERVDKAALQTAFNAITTQHDMLRAVFNGDRLMVRDANTTITIEEQDMTTANDFQAAIKEAAQDVQAGIDMQQALLRIVLFHAPAADYLFIAVHHLIIDGVSWRILLTDLNDAYQQALEGKDVTLPKKTHTYQDYANAAAEYLESYMLDQERPYWNKVQQDMEQLPMSLEKDYGRTFGHLVVTLDADATTAFLTARASAFNADVNDLLLTAVGRSYQKTTGQQAVSFQFEGHGREQMATPLVTDRTIGWFTSIYPVVLQQLGGELRHDLRLTKEAMHRVPNKGVGYHVLHFMGDPTFDRDHSPLICFNYLGEMDDTQRADSVFTLATDVEAGDDFAAENAGGTDITINCEVKNGEFQFYLDYNKALLTDAAARQLADGTLEEMRQLTDFLNQYDGQETTATDLGETEWTDAEFLHVSHEFEQRGEHLQRIYPLLPMQESMLLKHLQEPESWAYRQVNIFEMNTLPTEEQLRQALDRLAERHEVLRTAIIHDGVTAYRQAIVDRKLGLRMTDVSSAADQRAAVMQLREDILNHDFDLQRKPLMEVVCAKRSSNSCYLLVVTHHIIDDGWCLMIYMNDLFDLIDGKELPQQSLDGRYEAAIREILSKDRYKALSYWQQLLDGYETKAEISSNGEVPEQERTPEQNMQIAIDADLTDRLTALCQQEQATLSNAIELAWGLVLQTYSRTDDAVFAKVVSGRDNTKTDVNEVVGLFINSVPVRVKTTKESTARQMLRTLQQQAAESSAYDFCPLAEIQNQTELGRELLQSVIAFENYGGGSEEQAPQRSFELNVIDLGEENFDELNQNSFIDSEGRLVMNIVFNNHHYREQDIQRVLQMFKVLVEGMVAQPDAPLCSLPRMNADDMARTVALSEGETMAYNADETWVDMFQQRVREHPDNISVVDRTSQLTYKELDELSDHVAAWLLTKGVTPGDFVAIKMGRVKEFVVAVLGINKTGAAYVPVDPEYPQDRIEYMLEDSEAKVVIDEDTMLQISASGSFKSLATPTTPCYMIYTSGSTGKPKGVVISQASVRACATWNIKAFCLDATKKNLHHPSFSFDASTFDLFYPLAAGAEIHILDNELRKDMDGMARYISEHHITGMTQSTAIGMALLNQYDLDIEYIMLGGEKFLPVKKTTTKLFNGYGPTEFTCCSSYHIIDQDKDIDIPIGRAVPNSASFICDMNGNLLPQGVAGELCLAGVQIAQCYWHRPELTADKFCDRRFGDRTFKVYRTGDLARYNEQGELEFMGRIDTQVKLRGFRIELGEIENRASQYEGILAVAAEVKTVGGSQHLVLYYTVSAGITVEKDLLRDFMSETLTEYMVPDVYMPLDEMPMTPGGKVNRRALPAPVITSSAVYVEPEGDTERAVAAAMQQILGMTTPVGALDSFYELGGDSIKAIRLVSILRQQGIAVQVADVMKLKTVRAIAGINTDDSAMLTVSQEPWSGEVRDSAIFRFFKDQHLSAPNQFHQSMLLRCNKPIDVAMLQKAIDALVLHHDMLRAVVKDDHLFVRPADTRIMLAEHPLTDGETLDAACDTVIAQMDMATALFAPTLIHTGTDHLLFLAAHHAIVDGVSWRVLMEDLETACQQLSSGKPVTLPAKTNSYSDYVDALYSYRDSYALRQQTPYWERQQKLLLSMPTSDGKNLNRHFVRTTVAMTAADTKAFATARLAPFNADVNDLLLTAVGRSYCRMTGATALSVNLEGHGREPMDTPLYIDRTVGWFTSVYPVVIESLTGDARHDLRTVKETLHRIPNKGLGYNILRYIEGNSQLTIHNSQFDCDHVPQIGFNYLGEMDGESTQGLADTFFTMESYGGETEEQKDMFGPDLTINCEISGGIFTLTLDYNADKYQTAEAGQFAEGILTEINTLTQYLASHQEKEVTATDLGETEWTDAEFERVVADFATRGEQLQRIYPLTPMQEGMLLKHLQEPTSWAYRLISIYEANVVPTEEQLRRTLDRLAAKHEVLRTAIIHEGVEQYRQAIVDRQLGLQMVDFRHEKDPEAAIKALRADMLTNGYDLQRRPLLQVVCARKSDDSCYLLIATHHIIVDGWCIQLYMGDLMRYLQQELTGIRNNADELNTDGRYEAAVREILAKDKDKALGYWRNLLDGFETRTEIPSWGDVPEAEQAKEDTLSIQMDADTTTQLTQLCQQQHATLSNAVELAWGLVLQTYSRTDDAVFAKVVSGRDNTKTDVNEVVGLFINSVPVRVKTTKESTFRQMVHTLQQQAAETNTYDFCALAEIQQQSSLGSQLFQSVTAFENYNSGNETQETPADSFNLRPLVMTEENFDEIAQTAYVDDEGRLVLNITFNKQHYRQQEIERVLQLFQTLLTSFVLSPDVPLSSLDLLTKEQQLDITAIGAGNTVDYDKTDTLVSLFQKQVAKTPDAPAVVFKGKTLTYREVDDLTNRLAAHLINEYKVQPEEAVGVMIDRSELMVIYPMAIMKAGAAYMPLDYHFPADRLQYMCQDAGVRLVLSEAQRVSETMPDFQGDVLTSDILTTLPSCDIELPNIGTEQRYVLLYTSGSTGMPKGVALEHHSIVNFCHWYAKEFQMTPADHALGYANFGFDAHMMDIYPALTIGASVYIISSEMRMDLMEMNQYMEANAINVAFMTTQVGYMFATVIDNKSLRLLSVGGEKLMPLPKPRFDFYNAYGPTECTIFSTLYKITRDYDSSLIGRPLDNYQLFVVDESLRLVPKGVAGELIIAGEGVGRGYLHPAEKDAHKFTTLFGQPCYRTGDLVRWSEDHNIEFIGRIDGQVKLRGLRIEMGEIEARATKYDGVKQVAAAVKKIGGVENLCLYYTAETTGQTIDQKALKAFLAETLTDFMVPTAYMQLDTMPLNANGKIDRKNLPEPKVELEEIVPPETEMEQKVFDIVSEMLKTTAFGVTNNLVSLGLSSLAAMRLSAALQNQLHVQVKMADIMKQPTVRGIVAALSETDDQQTLKPYERREFYPLTENQRGLYIDWELNRETTQYNIPAIYRFDHIDADKLVEALKQSMEAHSYLKTRLAKPEGEVMQQRHDDEPVEVTLTTVYQEPDSTFFQQKVKPFDLFEDKLYRLEIISSPSSVYLFIDIHHILYDGLSTSIFLGDVLKAYGGEPLQPEHYQAYDFALYEQELMSGDAMTEAEQRFDGLVADSQVLSYADSSKPDGVADASVKTTIPAKAIDDFCAANGVTIGSYMQAAFAETARRLARVESPFYLTVSNGRAAGSELMSCVGMFVKTLPVVRPATSANTTIADYVKAMHEELQQTYAQDFYPYTRLVERHALRAEAMFVYQGGLHEGGDIAGVEQLSVELDTTKFPLTVTIYPEDGEYAVYIEYDGMRYSQKDMMLLASAVKNMSMSMATCQLLADAQTVDEAEKSELIKIGTGSTLDYDKTDTLVSLFQKQVAKTPDAPAVVFKGKTLTYREVDDLTNRLAAHLINEYKVQPEEAVGVMIDRSELMVIYPMAIMKAGAAYMPLDYHFPADRLQYMCQDAGVRLVLSEAQRVSETMPDFQGDVLTSDILTTLPSCDIELPNIGTEQRYVLLYTSGSTGMPKGVALEHHSIVNFCHWYVKEFQMTSADHALGYANFGFDAHMLDIFPTLSAGASVYIIPSEMRMDLMEMNQYMETNAINIAFMTTQVGYMFATVIDNKSLRLLSVGGEKLMPLKKPRFDFYNVYGPTECTIYSTYYKITSDYDSSLIGRPLDNYRLFVVDESLRLVPKGVAGELIIAGEGVGRGYLHPAEKDAHKFTTLFGQPCYRTGDLVRWSEDHNIEFLGRIDGQVKLRGLRIEMGEIEARATKYEGVKQVAAAVKKIGGVENLCLYYTAEAPDQTIDQDALKAFLAETLTDFMVPTAYMQLDTMPLNANGKIDRKNLPEPKVELEEIVPPETEMEKKLFDLISEQLKTKDFGVTNNLISLGMSSLAAMRLSAVLQQEMGLELQMKELLENPTIRHIAQMADSGELKKTSSMRLGGNAPKAGGNNPLQKRSEGSNPLQKRSAGTNPLEKRPGNPLEKRPGNPLEKRNNNPLEKRPNNPLLKRDNTDNTDK